jgi:phosphoglycerate dehydrogenase-like enzyme
MRLEYDRSQGVFVSAVLVSHRFNAVWGPQLRQAAATRGTALDFIVLPEAADARIAESDAAKAEVAFFTHDVFPSHSAQFFSATRKATGLKWMQVFNAGVDHPVFATILERGVKLTTAAGTTAGPIAQTAMAGLLMLARNYQRWLNGQRNRQWDPMRPPNFPRDLRGQNALVYGLGHIGKEFARLAQVMGLHVIGARRSARQADDPVDEFIEAARFRDVLSRCDWLVLTCPLTPETRGLANAEVFAALKPGACVINVGRGEVVVEAALIDALKSGQLGGAYLDVFEQEPLPPESPLWNLPNVYVTPHNATANDGNEARINALFLDNLARYRQGQPLHNEVRSV